jgi:hypothetical protein
VATCWIRTIREWASLGALRQGDLFHNIASHTCGEVSFGGLYGVIRESRGEITYALVPRMANPALHWAVDVVADRRLDVVLPPGLLLSGRITDGAGQPVAAARVSAHTLVTFQSSESTMSDTQGRYELIVVPGLYGVRVSPAAEEEAVGWSRDGIVVTEDTPLDITLETGVLLSGQVTDAAGNGLEFAIVSTSNSSASVETDAAGWYSLRVAPETPDLSVWAPGFVHREVRGVDVSAGRKLDIVLERGVRLAGRVTDAAGVLLTGITVGMRYGGGTGVRRAPFPRAPLNSAFCPPSAP